MIPFIYNSKKLKIYSYRTQIIGCLLGSVKRGRRKGLQRGTRKVEGSKCVH